VLPPEVVDRPKGYFPVPALTHLDGELLDRARDALYAPAAKQRGLFATDRIEALLAAPGNHRTRVGGTAVWPLALLELWLQAHGI
jgi:asparagine synthase (glutamine-hydrolysing)